MTAPLSEAEYAVLIRSFLVELNHLWVHDDERALRQLPALPHVWDEYREDLNTVSDDPVEKLRASFAYVDELIAADWERVGAAGYRAYSKTLSGKAK